MDASNFCVQVVLHGAPGYRSPFTFPVPRLLLFMSLLCAEATVLHLHFLCCVTFKRKMICVMVLSLGTTYRRRNVEDAFKDYLAALGLPKHAYSFNRLVRPTISHRRHCKIHLCGTCDWWCCIFRLLFYFISGSTTINYCTTLTVAPMV